jgi:hypothetical protein
MLFLPLLPQLARSAVADALGTWKPWMGPHVPYGRSSVYQSLLPVRLEPGSDTFAESTLRTVETRD